MKEHPIIFSGAMVRAILGGNKTQTRRVVNPQPWEGRPMVCAPGWEGDRDAWLPEPCEVGLNSSPQSARRRCPYGQPGDDGPGDLLWVREAWCGGEDQGHDVYFRADWCPDHDGPPLKWRPSIYMPRALSRITLEVVEVRVQRLQDISEEDARAEMGGKVAGIVTTRGHFMELWDSINAKCAPWASNPWVWALTFKRVKP